MKSLGEGETDKERKDPVKMKTEMWVMKLCQETQRLVSSHQKKERQGGDSCSELRKEATLLTTWLWTSGLQNCEVIRLCCLSCHICGTLLCSPSKRIHWRTKSSFWKQVNKESSFPLLKLFEGALTVDGKNSSFIEFQLKMQRNSRIEITTILQSLMK